MRNIAVLNISKKILDSTQLMLGADNGVSAQSTALVKKRKEKYK